MKLKLLELKPDKKDPLFQNDECQQLLAIYEDFYPKIGFELPWVAYLIVEKEEVLGTCSFVGKPKDGEVEIAYWTFEQNEGKGVASFACKELVSIAKKENKRLSITAKTAPEKNASNRILEKNGFTYDRVVQDDEIGDAWLWKLSI